jgi:predicted transcriptional regulator
LSRTTVTQHLTELKNVGLIQGHITGVKTNYCINPEKLNEFQKSLESFFQNIHIENCKC